MAPTSKSKSTHVDAEPTGVDPSPAADDAQTRHGSGGAGEPPQSTRTPEHELGSLLLDLLAGRSADSGSLQKVPRRDPGPRDYEAELIRGHKRVLSRTPDSIWFRKGERVPISAKEYDYLRKTHARQKFEDRHADELVIRKVPVFRFYKDGRPLPDSEWPEERLPMRTPKTW